MIYLDLKKGIVLVATLAAISLSFNSEGLSQTIRDRPFGRDGGNPFALVEFQKIQMRTGNKIDALILDDSRHGDEGGRLTETITLEPGEYIEAMDIRAGNRVDYIVVRTNKGKVIGGGNSRGGDRTILENVRVLRLGGRAGATLDQLRVEYIEGYKPSKIVKKNAVFVTDVGFGPKKFTVAISESAENGRRILKSVESFTSNEYSVSAKADFAFSSALKKVSVKNSFTHSWGKTTKNELETQVKNASATSKTTEITLDTNQIYVEKMKGDIMEDDKGRMYFIPSESLPTDVMTFEDAMTQLSGDYDLSRGIVAREIQKKSNGKVAKDAGQWIENKDNAAKLPYYQFK